MQVQFITAAVAIVSLAVGISAWRLFSDDPNECLRALEKAKDAKERVAAVNQVIRCASQLDPRIALRVLGAVTRDPSPRVRVAAVCATGTFIPDADQAIPDLCRVIKADEDEVVRVSALETLGLIISPRAKRYDAVLDVFFLALEDRCELVRLRASATISKSDRAEEVVPTLVELIESKDQFVRWQSLRGLGRLGAKANRAVPFVEKALSDRSARVRVEAVLALVRTGYPLKAEPELRQALQSRDMVIRAVAVEALQRLEAAGGSR
jgi:HEAT repeat protein